MRAVDLCATLVCLASCTVGCARRGPFGTARLIQPADIRGLELRGGVLTGLEEDRLICQKHCEHCGHALSSVVICRKPRFRRGPWGKSTRFVCPACGSRTTMAIQVRPKPDPLDGGG